jgi:hypothetical protein
VPESRGGGNHEELLRGGLEVCGEEKTGSEKKAGQKTVRGVDAHKQFVGVRCGGWYSGNPAEGKCL